MSAADHILEGSLAKWFEAQPLELPPREAVVLWQEATRTIYVEDSLGPAVPYGPVIRTDSESNYGYTRLKGQLHLVNSIPELTAWPEYAEFVRKINGEDTPIESVGCAIGFFPVTDHEVITHRVGSYVDIVFSDSSTAENPTAYLTLAAKLMASLAECERWWSSAEIGVQRLRHLPSASRPLGIIVRLSGDGRSEEEARQCFQVSLQKVGTAIDALARILTSRGDR